MEVPLLIHSDVFNVVGSARPSYLSYLVEFRNPFIATLLFSPE